MTTITELKKLLFSMILKTPIWLVHLAANQSSVMSIPTTGSSFKNTMTIQTALIIILEGTIGSCSSLNQRRDCSVECTSSVRE